MICILNYYVVKMNFFHQGSVFLIEKCECIPLIANASAMICKSLGDEDLTLIVSKLAFSNIVSADWKE